MLRSRNRAVSSVRLAAVLVVAIVAGVSAQAIALPADRSYELVSPPDKNGADVMAESTRTRARADGNAISFTSLGGFGDVHGTGVAAEYMARRTLAPGTNGWATHAIFPILDPNSFNSASQGMDTVYSGELSDDFTKGVLRTFTNLIADPNVENISNLYLREDLSTPGIGMYELLTACPVCVVPLRFSTAGPNPLLADATPDLGHILFEARYNYTADAPPQTAGCLNTGIGCRPRLYEWDHGELRFVGILPDSEGGGAADFSIAGVGPSGGRYTQRTLSDDGSRVIFTTPPNSGGAVGPLYLREDHATTVRISASERTDCAGDLTCGGDDIPDPVPDPAGEQPATYEIASADASRIFFRTGEQLVDDDDNGGADLYMYDASLPPEDPHNLTRLSIDGELGDAGEVQGVFGASEAGDAVYFVASGQLVSGEPVLDSTPGIFLWRDGALTYVGALASPSASDPRANSQGTPWGTGQLASRVSPDGSHLLFTSHNGAGLTGYDHNTTGCGISFNDECTELYLYDADEDSLVCATCGTRADTATSDASFVLGVGRGGAAPTAHLTRPLSDDGSRVFFTSGERLVDADRNGRKRDVYLYDAETGQHVLLTSGRSDNDSYFLDASADGDDAFFVTRERLSRWDGDNSYDLYDARIGVGAPEPPPAVQECVGELCQGAFVAPPAAQAPRETQLASGGNVTGRAKTARRKKCKKGKVRKRVNGKVRCVRKKRAKARRGNR